MINILRESVKNCIDDECKPIKTKDEAFNYLMYLSDKFRIKFIKGPDYYLTKIINYFFIFD